jgi:hypothetical protein
MFYKIGYRKMIEKVWFQDFYLREPVYFQISLNIRVIDNYLTHSYKINSENSQRTTPQKYSAIQVLAHTPKTESLPFCLFILSCRYLSLKALKTNFFSFEIKKRNIHSQLYSFSTT